MTGIPGSNHAVKGIAEGDYDMAVANFEMAEANVEVAKATVEQNEASLKLADANLSYTTITSPVSGIVIDRKVDAGQTLASLYQTPVMFVVAPELDKRVFIQASIDEADIGFVRKAKENEQPVHFTVDAYQNEQFEGKIIQVRLGPKAALPNAQANVVTYVAVVEAPNTELKLLPGMTANLVFRIEQHDGVLKIPNAALRFHPKPEFVHPKHLPVLEGLKTEEEKEESGTASKDKADEKADDEADENEKDAAKKSEEKSAEKAGDDASGEKKNADAMDDSKEKSNGKKKDGKKKDDKKKYVWIIDGELLSPVEVKTKLVDSRHTELVSGELKDGDKVVTGMKTAAEAAAAKK
jgi:HlyD family secretion protein